MTVAARLKHEAIRQVEERGRLIAEVARDFGVSNKQLYRWLRESHSELSLNPQQSALAEEIIELRTAIYQMSQQLERLNRQARALV